MEAPNLTLRNPADLKSRLSFKLSSICTKKFVINSIFLSVLEPTLYGKSGNTLRFPLLVSKSSS